MATAKKPICVTGASGYCASHIVELLLRNGETVHGTVRDPGNKKNDFLNDLAKQHAAQGGKLVLFAADLSKPGSFDEAVAGCEVVVHVAAVVGNTYKKDPFVEMINPGVDGVKNVAASCKKAGVKRIVFTSSQATISCAECYRPLKSRGRLHTEDEWLTHVSPTYGTYNYSKIKAEQALQAAWDGELISILPSLVLGPALSGSHAGGSLQIPKLICNKEYKRLPMFGSDWVDVRDVAKAHYFACTKKDMPTGRYLVTQGQMLSTSHMGEAIHQRHPDLKVPTKEMPWVVMWAVSWIDKRLDSHLLYERAVKKSANDNSKLLAQGFTYDHSDLVETMDDVVKSFHKFGVIKK